MAEFRPPIALTIAGSDPSGGAGIQADLKTFTALGIYGASVVTALTAQNTRGVIGIHRVPADFIAAQFDAVTSDLDISAAKTGMLGDVETVLTVAGLLSRRKLPHLVVDPVMIATSGDRLLDPNAIAAVRNILIPLATIITPNIPEAAALLDCEPAHCDDDAVDQARRLLALGCGAVLLKGGHASGSAATDVFVTSAIEERLTRLRIDTANTHGTGCTLSAAIAAGLAEGLTLLIAVERAKDFVWDALKSGVQQRIGTGNSPVDHLFRGRKRHDSA